ncbi:MAG: serine/threonine protein kinase [Candidatus Aminicenantes bacterium]|nr:serine/threonine protein kinase [Candidatus Aminicenantes bacterium]
MGEVYLAEDSKLHRRVALKFLPRALTNDADARMRFEREAQAAAALNHPNIVTIHEIGEHEDQVYIAMEYVEGQTLKELIAVGPLGEDLMGRPPSTVHRLPIPQVIDIASQIASGLAAAHAKGIIHRDIKPANIFVASSGAVKILDFGLAKLVGSQVTLTKNGSTLGTVAYMSPEQGLGRAVDQRTDIWSLGVMLYEMLGGRLPFQGEYEQEMIYSILNEKPEPLARLRPDAPTVLERIVNRALAKNREKRYFQVEELDRALRAIAAVDPQRGRKQCSWSIKKAFRRLRGIAGSRKA